jgi:adenylosuccinate synthase
MSQQAILLVDLGFGDSGKGISTDALCRRAQVHTVVRYNGGAQAGHTVVTDDGRSHTFSQIGAGSFCLQVRTHLSAHMVCHPAALLAEAEQLSRKGVPNVLYRVSIHRDALLISPYQQALNRLRELSRGAARHGSVGVGVGETVGDARSGQDDVLYARHLTDRQQLKQRLQRMRQRKRLEAAALPPPCANQDAWSFELSVFENNQVIDTFVDLASHLAAMVQVVDTEAEAALTRRPGTVLFEGAQGVLLDEEHGFFPHTTFGRCTLAHAESLLAAWDFSGDVERLAVMRSFMTRHGAGPLPTESKALATQWTEQHNSGGLWQGDFRVGHADFVLWRTARNVCRRLDGLIITHVDALEANPRPLVCNAYVDASGEKLTEIPSVGDNRTPTHAARLQLLSGAQCVLQPLEGVTGRERASNFFSTAEEALRLPVKFVSRGPRASDLTER